MHQQVADWVAAEAVLDTGRCPSPSVLEIGSLDINGSVRAAFPHAASYHGVDLVAGPGVDEVADAADWRPPRAYDVVVCAEVLEHAPRWEAVLRTCWDALAPGGLLLMTCATEGRAPHSAIDGLEVRPDEHYGNVPPGDVVALLRRLGADRWSIEVATGRGDLYLACRAT